MGSNWMRPRSKGEFAKVGVCKATSFVCVVGIVLFGSQALSNSENTVGY